MASAIHKITLSSSRDIPFNKLVLSQANVRRVKAGVSVVIDGEVTAGGRNLAVKPENEIYLIQRVKGG